MTATAAAPAALHAAFLAHLPRIAAHAGFAARRSPCPHERADRTAEVVALAWRHFVTLSRRGKDPAAFVSTLACGAPRQCGPAAGWPGRTRRADALSPVARRRHGFTVSGFGRSSRLDPRLAEALADNTRTPVPEQAAFRPTSRPGGRGSGRGTAK